MYGLPKDFNAEVFVGREIEDVSFTVNTINFSFGSGLSITTESGVDFWCLSGGGNKRIQPPVVETNLMMLLGLKIIRASASYEGRLELVFIGGHVLAFVDDSAQYEAYRICIDGREVIV